MDGHGGRFGDYELLELLGRGGMGEVWRAEDTRRGRTVAVKLLAAELTTRPDFRERFRREAQLTAVLSSPHVVPIHDWGEIDGRLFLDMRLVDGGSLADALAAHPSGLPPVRALRVLEQVAAALDAAHDRSMVHRDVKPANVLVTGRPDAPFSYLTDFGIARIVDETSSARLTESGQVLGTVGYMAPELFIEGTATSATDVYALGCLAFEMLTGRPAVAASSVPAAMHEHVFAPPPRLATHRPALGRLDTVLAGALAKRPEDRPTSAGAFAAAARAAWDRDEAPQDAVGTRSAAPAATLVSDPSAASTDVVPADRRPSPARRHWPVAVALATVVALGVGGGYAVVGDVGSAPTTVSSATGAAIPSATPRVLPVSVENANAVLPTPDGRATFLAEAENDEIRRIDLTTGRVTDRYRLEGAGQGRMQLSPDGRLLAVALNGYERDGSATGVGLIDLAAGGTSIIALGARPGDLIFGASGALLFVSLPGADDAPGTSLVVVDVAARRVSRTVSVAAEPRGLALSADGTTVAVACGGGQRSTSGSIALVPVTGGPTTFIRSARKPRFITALPDGRFAFSVSYQNNGAVDLVDPLTRGVTRRGEASVTAPVRLTTTDGGRRLLVTQAGTRGTPRVAESALLDVASGDNLFRAPLTGLLVAEPTPDGRRAVLLTKTSVAVVDLPS